MRLYSTTSETRKAQRELGAAGVTDRLYWCYRCRACTRLITKLEVISAQSMGRANLCPCGSKTVSPTNPKWWEELLLPRCWKLIYAIYMKRIAPAPPPMDSEELAEANRVGKKATRAFEKQMSDLIKRGV